MRITAIVGLAVLLAGCSEMREMMHPDRVGVARASYGQVPVFDGHELWVAYDCGGARVDVRFLGAWADATLADGSVRRLARTGGGGGRIAYAGSGYALDGEALAPSWTGSGGPPVACHGAVA